MSPSKEVAAAVGEAPTAQEQLDVKRIELQQAEAALAAAELAFDIQRTIELQNTVEVLRQFIPKLEAKAAVEAATEAKADAGALHARLRQEYAEALAAMAPELEEARRAIAAAAIAAQSCTTMWARASRRRYELKVLAMRFGLEEHAIEPLPLPPVAELTKVLGNIVEDAARMSVSQPAPVYSSTASDTPEQITLNKMVAAHRDVIAMGTALHLDAEVIALFAKAGSPAPVNNVDKDAAFIPGFESSLPPGAWQGALGPTSLPPTPETPAQKKEREAARRASTRGQADVVREEARRIAAEDLKKKSREGMRG